jgi:hypothetical protein
MDLNKTILYIGENDTPLDDQFWLPQSTFDRHVETTTTIPDKKFYYPIPFKNAREIYTAHLIKIPPDIQSSVLQGNCLILIVCPREGYSWNIYSDVIKTLKNNYNFLNNHFVVISNNPVQSTDYGSIFFNFWEYFSYSSNILKEIQLGQESVLSRKIRPYKFIALNRRCHAHRFAAFTKLYPYRDQGLLSFAKTGHQEIDLSPTFNYFNYQKEQFAKNYPSAYEDWLSQDLDSIIPLELDKSIDPYDHASLSTNPINDEHNLKFYQSYLHIVIETSVYNIFFSEKTFKPIKYFQPFVLIGGVGSLKKLKELGYKTFANYIDERYDDIVDNQERINYAIESATNFMMRDDLPQCLHDMYHILKHNHETLISNSASTIKKLASDLNKLLSKND